MQRRIAGWLSIALLAWASQAAAQYEWSARPPLPSLPAGGEIEGRVVDAADGKPLADVIVVARWEWIDWIPPRLHGGGYYVYQGTTAHVDETVTDARGAFRFPAWRAGVRVDGKGAPRQPRLLFFKPVYEPLSVEASALPVGEAKVKRFTGSPAEYASAIAVFQRADDHGLAWRHPEDSSRRMPRMVMALYREKARLGDAGKPIRGANLLPGRSGRGEIAGLNGTDVSNALLSITWTLRRAVGSDKRTVVEQKRVGADGRGHVFYVSAWRSPGLAVPGWEVDMEASPLLRVYAWGYRTSNDVRWPPEGGFVRLEPLPSGDATRLTQLRDWRRDVDAAIAAGGAEAARQQAPLAWAHLTECEKLTPDLRAKYCHAVGSLASVAVDELRRRASFTMETLEGVEEMKIVVLPGATSHAAAAAVPGAYAPREPVRGFSVEPTK